MSPKDPLEEAVAEALTRGEIAFARNVRLPTPLDDKPFVELDFYLPTEDVYIEVKRFYSARILWQASTGVNLIVLQGAKAVEFFTRRSS